MFYESVLHINRMHRDNNVIAGYIFFTINSFVFSGYLSQKILSGMFCSGLKYTKPDFWRSAGGEFWLVRDNKFEGYILVGDMSPLSSLSDWSDIVTGLVRGLLTLGCHTLRHFLWPLSNNVHYWDVQLYLYLYNLLN